MTNHGCPPLDLWGCRSGYVGLRRMGPATCAANGSGTAVARRVRRAYDVLPAFTASFNGLPALNVGAVEAAISTFSPDARARGTTSGAEGAEAGGPHILTPGQRLRNRVEHGIHGLAGHKPPQRDEGKAAEFR